MSAPSDTNANLPVRSWHRLPVIVRAIITGGIAAAAGTIPWALLVSINMKQWPVVPWAIVPTGLYLWFYFWYLRGNGWPQSTQESRRRNCRANRLSGEVWAASLGAGFLGLVSIVLFQSVMNRLVTLPHQSQPDISQYPLITVALWLVTSALVAGVAEEASFRGYLQKPIEQSYGPVIAIIITGILFGFAHFSHPEVGLILLPYYIIVAAVYGAVAYYANSIFPSMVLHAGGNLLGSLDLFARGRSEWQTSATSSPLVWETGTDASFWLSLAGFLIIGAGTVVAYRGLGRVVRETAIPSS